MKLMKLFVLAICFNTVAAFGANTQLPTVDNVEVERYIGKWYAISALPQFFTRKCLAQTAEYEILDPETVSVLNTCLKKKGKTKTIEGQAVIINKETNATLEVTFNSFWTRLFRVKGDYQILRLDENYDYVLVGSNNLKSLWIMSRVPSMPKEVYESYKQTAEELGFDVSKLIISKF